MAALRRAMGIAAMGLVLLCAAPGVARAQSAPQRSPALSQAIDVERLDRSIDETIHRREFTWRSPPSASEQPQGRWISWVEKVAGWIRRGWEWLLDRIADWLRPPSERESGPSTASPRKLIEIWTSVVVALLIAAVFVYFFRRRNAAVVAVKAPASATAATNLADESLTADRLPESSWLKLAEESMARGEYRLALRALYLAALNHMSHRDFISIRRWKTGLDYRRELERRARTMPSVSPELTPVFARVIAMFERGWYGRQAVERTDVDALMGDLEEMRRYAQRA